MNTDQITVEIIHLEMLKMTEKYSTIIRKKMIILSDREDVVKNRLEFEL
jgi:hypothetical protein